MSKSVFNKDKDLDAQNNQCFFVRVTVQRYDTMEVSYI